MNTKTLAQAFALSCILIFTGCKEEDKNKLVGKWIGPTGNEIEITKGGLLIKQLYKAPPQVIEITFKSNESATILETDSENYTAYAIDNQTIMFLHTEYDPYKTGKALYHRKR